MGCVTYIQSFISKVSSIAHERRGLDRAKFAREWTVKIAVLVAKSGAAAALRRVRACSAAFGGADGGAEGATAPGAIFASSAGGG